MYCHAVSRHDSGQTLGPCGWVIISGSLQHLQQGPVHTLGLSITLRMESRCMGLVDSRKQAQLVEQFGFKFLFPRSLCNWQGKPNSAKKSSYMTRMHVEASASGKAKAHAHSVK